MPCVTPDRLFTMPLVIWIESLGGRRTRLARIMRQLCDQLSKIADDVDIRRVTMRAGHGIFAKAKEV